MKLESNRLFIYPASNDEIIEIINKESNNDLKEAYKEMLEGCIKNPDNRIWYTVWFIKSKENNVIIGDMCFKGLNDDGMVEIGYGLYDGYCNHGYMTEAVDTITKWALGLDYITRIEAEAETNNYPSINILKRCRFIELGINGLEGPRYVLRGNKDVR